MSSNNLSRRNAIKTAGTLGALAAIAGVSPATHAQPPSNPPGEEPQQARAPIDRDFVIAAGMTAEEAECWETIARAAGQFFNLPEQHPMDRQEVASAIHIVQNKLLSRPTYRTYLEKAKAAHEKRQAQP